MKRVFFTTFFLFMLVLTNAIAQGPAGNIETIVQGGHYAAILGVGYSPDGQLLATASRDKTVRIWEVQTGRELRSMTGHAAAVRSVAFSPDGRQLISAGLDHKAIIWDVMSGMEVRQLVDSSDEIRSAIFSPKGTYILTGGHRTNAILWDAKTGQRLSVYKTKPEVCYQCASSMAFSADEKTIYTSAGDRVTLFWEVGKADTIRSVKFNNGSCSSCNTYVDVDPTGNTIAKADYGGGLFIVNAKNGKKLRQLAEKEDFRKVQFHPGGKYLLTLVDYNGLVIIWDIDSGDSLFQIKSHGGIHDASFSPDGKSILTAGENNEARSWSFPGKQAGISFRGMITRVEEKGLSSDELYYINRLKDISLSPDGKLVAQCRRANEAVIWDFATGRIIKRLQGHKSVITCLDFSPDGKFLVTGSVDRTIKIWHVSSGTLLRSIDAHQAMVLSVHFNADGTEIISGSWDGLFKVWERSSGKQLSACKVHDGSPYSTAISPNGIYAVSGGLDKKLVVTELDSRSEFRTLIGHTDVVQSIAFSPDGNTMLTASWDGSAKLWDVKTGWQISKFKASEEKLYDAEFDSSGNLMVTAGDDKTARLWDVRTGELIRTFKGHLGGVYYAKITPGNRYLITAARDNTVKIWDLEKGNELVTHVTLDEGHWMAKTADGYFEGSPEATKTLFFVKGIKSFSLDQFFEKFYKPGIYRQSLTMSTRQSSTPGNIIGLLDESPPPSIEILSPPDGDVAKNDHQEVILKVTNNGGGINEIRLLHNGKCLELPDRLARTPKAGQDMVITYSVNLVPGENEISVSGVSSGRVESTPEKRLVKYPGTEKAANLYLLAIGINEYENPALTLNYARSDAEAFVKLVEERSAKLFKQVECIALYDKDATRQQILSKLDSLQQKIRPEDVFYLYYAGHGGMLEQEFFFIPTESVSLYQGDKLDEQAISAKTINQRLRSIAALKQVVILDACHSGASTQILASRGLQEEKALAQLARSNGIHIMAAAGSEQQAVEFGQLGHGVFTYALIEALGGKADGAPNDNKVTIYELKSYLDDQVPELSKKYQGVVQYPTTFSLGQDFPMVFGE